MQKILHGGFPDFLGGIKPFFIEGVGQTDPDAGKRHERIVTALHRLVIGALALHVEMPARQLAGQSDVLPLLADGDGQKLVGDDDLHRPVVLVDDDPRDLGRSQGVADELGGVHVPGDDVDLLAAQFLDDALDPAALHPHAGAHRVDIGVVGGDGDLGPHARLPGGPHDGHDTLADFRDLGAEKGDDKIRVRPRQHDLRPPRILQHVQDEGPDAVAAAVALLGDLLAHRQDALGLAEIDDDVPPIDPLHDPVDDLAPALDEDSVDRILLRVLQLLDDDLLGGLGGDAAEGVRVHLGAEAVADLAVRVEQATLTEADLKHRILDHLGHLFELEHL